MKNNPYSTLNKYSFWKNGVENSDAMFPENIYNPKWKINDNDKIATMGSCFAQHIAHWLRTHKFNVPFYDTDGFNEDEQMFSANYGNVYTVRQALQLIQESVGRRVPSEIAWGKDDKFIDALRPNSIKNGFKTVEDVLIARKLHLASICRMVVDFDVFIFTLGLTEAWEIKNCGTIIPTAPGVIGGEFNPENYRFLNFNYTEILEDLKSLYELLTELRTGKPFKMLLTVSPVPLTATVTDQHVLLASTYSKAVLRSVAGDFSTQNALVEYFPSFEIINNPAARGIFFEDNLRSVKKSAVENVMTVFSSLALINPRVSSIEVVGHDPRCEDILLEEFSHEDNTIFTDTTISMVCVGDSHLAGFRSKMSEELNNRNKNLPYYFPVNWGKIPWMDFDKNKYITHFLIKDGYKKLIDEISVKDKDILVLVGLGLAGDDIIRCHGSMGRDFSPKVTTSKNLNELMEFYRPFIRDNLNRVKPLDKNAPYKKVFWVVCPDMCVDVAKVRLGEDFVNSGSYLIHKQAYRSVLNAYITGFNKIQFIFHDDYLCDPANGFSLNKYSSCSNPFDIHCNADFYTNAVSKIVTFI